MCDVQVRKHLVAFKLPIYRATYTCKQECCRDFDAEAEEDKRKRERMASDTSDGESSIQASDDDTDCDSEQDSSRSHLKSGRVRPTNANRTCKVILHVSYFAFPF